MPVFAWDESCSVHVKQFDEQHKKLFEMVNNLAEAMRAGKGQAAIREVVDGLAIYTRTHFLQEETVMRQTGYPALAAHQAQHAQLMEEVEKYKKELQDGKSANTVAVLGFLQKWLLDHIRKSDKAYSDHMNARGVR